MNNILVTYKENNKIAQSLMYVLSKTKGVEIDDDAILTDKEIKLIEKSRKSGIHTDVSKLKELIRKKQNIWNYHSFRAKYMK